QHLDFNRKIVQIYEPKTMNVRMTILSETTTQLLEEYITKYRPKPRFRYKEFVFINQQRRKMSPRAIQYLTKRLSTKFLGEENAITPHYFRAACAVHLLERGVDIRQVQEIIGWKSLSVVQNYTRVTLQRQAQLKEQHHPSFQKKLLRPQTVKEPSSLLATQIESLRQQISEEQQGYKQDLVELKQAFQKEQLKWEQERQAYEQRMSGLLKAQELKRDQERQAYEQKINKLLKAQEQLLQILGQQS
ncbi:MAG: tyrosine-type recombinase/integrase, partial [Candidatus Hodarchaeota archaeon]